MDHRPILPKPGPLRVLLVGCVLAAAACGGGRTLSVPDFRGSPAFRSETVRLDVRNQNFADVVVYGSRGGSWHRIGNVTGNSAEVFEIPDQLTDAAASVRLRVHAIGSSNASDFVTEPIYASYGAVVVLRIAPVLRMSSWSVR